MPSLKELRQRRRSIQSTKKITSAMKIVAAARLRTAQSHVEHVRPYFEAATHIINVLIAQEEEVPLALARGRSADQVHLLLVLTGDRGLCGGFNAGLIRETYRQVNYYQSQNKRTKLICIGRKGYESLKQTQTDTILEHYPTSHNFAFAQTLAQQVIQRFTNEEFDTCSIIYNHFRSALSQNLTVRSLIPVPQPLAHEEMKLYQFEPQIDMLSQHFVPYYLALSIYQALLENHASEQGARMTSMDNATRNANDMIRDLTLLYNRSRQAHITRELIEIISGAEAI